MILKTKTKNNNNSKNSRRQKSIITFPGGGGGGKELIQYFQFILQKIKVSGLRNYTGCAEWYAHAFFAYT